MMKRVITTKIVERKGMFSQRTIFLIRNLVERLENAAPTTWTNISTIWRYTFQERDVAPW